MEYKVQKFQNDPLLSKVDISSSNFIIHTTKRNEKQFQHQQHIQNSSDKQMFLKLKKDHPDVIIGFTTFLKIKPLYISKCTVQDVETCSCTKHFNLRGAYETLINLSKFNNL